MGTIKHIVAQLIKKHGTNDPFEIAERMGILIIVEPLGETLGYFNTYKRIAMIHINSKLSERRQKFVCAHELGHRVLHRQINTSFLRKNTLYSVGHIEREANEFAAELLLPDSVVRDFEENGFTIQEAASTYGVPIEAAQLKNRCLLDTGK